MKRAIGIVGLVVVLVAGCGYLPSSGTPTGSGTPTYDRVDMTGGALAGTWRIVDRSSTVTFLDDKTFAAVGLPYVVFPRFPGVLPDDFDKDHDVITASGFWSLGGSVGDLNGPHDRVELHVRVLMGRPSSTSTALRAAKVGEGGVVLMFYIGDPDLNNRVVYEKCTVDCPSPTPPPTATPGP